MAKKTASENASATKPATKPATKKTPVKDEKGFEESLWDSDNRLRGSVESSEYKHVVLSLIFLKFVSDKFEEHRAALIAEGKQNYTDMVEFYAMQNVFYLPETSRWNHIQQHAKQDAESLLAWIRRQYHTSCVKLAGCPRSERRHWKRS